MGFILQIYKKLFGFLIRDKLTHNISADKLSIFSIDIDLNYSRYISIYIPKPLDPNKILDLAESYASAIIDMGSGQMAQDAIKMLETSLDKNNNLEKSLYDNIVYYIVYKSEIRADINDPMIRPLSVFKK